MFRLMILLRKRRNMFREKGDFLFDAANFTDRSGRFAGISRRSPVRARGFGRTFIAPESRLLEIKRLYATLGAAFFPGATQRRLCARSSPGGRASHPQADRRCALASERRARRARRFNRRRKFVR